jgi:ABC-2 type transport system permease protein
MTTITSTIQNAPAALAGARPPRRRTLVTSTLTITRRALLRYLRTPQLIVLASIQMAMFFLIYRYLFGGAIRSVGIPYVDYLVPGFIATGVLFSGIGTATATAEDAAGGFIDRLRSLPIPRSSVLAGRALADTAIFAWSTAFTAAIAFAVGFRLHGSALDGLAAFGLVVVFGLAFEWLFVTMGLFAGNAQVAQGMGMIVFPFAFISSAYVPVASMPGWLQVFAKHQPLTYMVDAVRALTLGPHAHALVGHPASYFVTRALVWALAILVVSLPIAVAKYRRG